MEIKRSSLSNLAFAKKGIAINCYRSCHNLSFFFFYFHPQTSKMSFDERVAPTPVLPGSGPELAKAPIETVQSSDSASNDVAEGSDTVYLQGIRVWTIMTASVAGEPPCSSDHG